MNLSKKKKLAMRTLKLGKKRVIFSQSRINEIKEAITKQDILDLKNEGAIFTKGIGGRKKTEKKNKRRCPGKIKKSLNKRKKEYVSKKRRCFF